MSVDPEELRRERQLLRERLAKLDREIEEKTPAAPAPDPVSEAAPKGAVPVPAEEILEQYRKAPRDIASQTKLGCLLYVIVALALAFGAIEAIHLIEQAQRHR